MQGGKGEGASARRGYVGRGCEEGSMKRGGGGCVRRGCARRGGGVRGGGGV